MKKFPKFLALFVSVLFAGFLFAGCDKDSGPILESISLKDNTLVLQVPQNDDFYSRLQDVIVIAKYSNGEKEITYEDLTFSNTINTAELGDQTLTITYDGKSVNVTITITEHFDTMYVKDNTIPTSVLQYHDFTIDNAVLVFQSSNGEASNIEYKLSEHDDIVVEGDRKSVV